MLVFSGRVNNGQLKHVDVELSIMCKRWHEEGGITNNRWFLELGQLHLINSISWARISALEMRRVEDGGLWRPCGVGDGLLW